MIGTLAYPEEGDDGGWGSREGEVVLLLRCVVEFFIKY